MLPNHNQQRLTVQRAEEIAATALAFLTEDVGRLTRFLSATGLSPQALSRDASSQRVLAAVLQHLTDDESLLLVFAASAGLPPAEIAPARDILQADPRRGDGS